MMGTNTTLAGASQRESELISLWLTSNKDMIDSVAQTAAQLLLDLSQKPDDIEEERFPVLRTIFEPVPTIAKSDGPNGVKKTKYSFVTISKEDTEIKIKALFRDIANEKGIQINHTWKLLLFLYELSQEKPSTTPLLDSLKECVGEGMKGTVYAREDFMGKTKKELIQLGILPDNSTMYTLYPDSARVSEIHGSDMFVFIPSEHSRHYMIADLSFVFQPLFPKHIRLARQVKERWTFKNDLLRLPPLFV